MPNLHLLFSHNLTIEQEKDAKINLKCANIFPLPIELQKLWAQIPPENELDITIVDKFKNYLQTNSKEKDFVLIQGEFGITYSMVNWCFKNARIPIYATTKRVAKEIKKEDGTVKSIKVFKHVQFRRYKK